MAQPQPLLSKQEFRDIIIEAIRKRVPDFLTEPFGELTVRVTSPSGEAECRSSLDRSWEQYCRHPDGLDGIVERWALSLEAGFAHRVDPDLVIPCLKTPEWLQTQPEEVRPFLWSEPYNEEIIIAYAQYKRGLAFGFNEASGLRREELRQRSLANLRRMSPNIEGRSESGFCVLTAGNMWDSSLMLLDELRHHPALGNNGGRVMAVPDRDSFFIADDTYPAAVFQLAIAATTEHRTADYPLSPRLFAWGDGQWEPLDRGLYDPDHAILNPEEVAAPESDGKGGCVMPLHIATQLMPDARSIYRLFLKLNAYLSAAKSPEYCSRFGSPTPQTHCIEVRMFVPRPGIQDLSDPAMLAGDPHVMDVLQFAGYWLQDPSVKDTCVSIRATVIVVVI